VDECGMSVPPPSHAGSSRNTIGARRAASLRAASSVERVGRMGTTDVHADLVDPTIPRSRPKKTCQLV